MSRSDEAERIAQVDRDERARRRQRQEAFAAERASAAAEAKRAQELKLLGEVKAAKASGAMPSTSKVRHRPVVKAGKAPVLGTRTVDDPMEAGSKLKATVNLAEHPLEMMLARRRLTQAQYEAGIRFRAIYEHAMIGPGRGIDPSKIKVDGGKMGDPLSDAVLHAHGELKRILPRLGRNGSDVVLKVCGQGMSISDLAKVWPGGDSDKLKIAFIGPRLKEALDVLAEEVWGATGPDHGRISGERYDTVIYDEQAVAVANQTYLRKRGISL